VKLSDTTSLNKYIIRLVFLICCNALLVKAFPVNDSLKLRNFNSLRGNQAKMNWLLNNELIDLNKFITSYPAVYDSLSTSVLHSNNELLKYQLKLLDGSLHYQKNHYQKAVPIFLNILNEKKFINQDDSVKVIIYLKNCFGSLLNYTKVFEMHQILTNMVKRNPVIKMHDLGLPLSSVYINVGLIDEGVKYLKLEYQNNPKKNKDINTEVNFYNNLGIVWKKANNPDSAIYYYEKASERFNEVLEKEPQSGFNIFFKGLLDGNIGQALMLKKQYLEAIPLLKNDVRSSLKFGNILNAAISYNELAHCYFEIDQYTLAENYSDSALVILKDIDAPKEYLISLKLRGELYQRINKFKEAVMIYQEYNALKDSIDANDKELLILNQQISFQTHELQEKINAQEKQMNAKLLIEEKRNTQRILMFVLILMMLAILIFGYFSFLKSKNREKQLSDKNEEITVKSQMLSAALKEKELLMKEVHHRVKNNMQIIISLLKLQSEKINDKQVEVYFSEARNRIQSMALIHEFLYKKERMDYMQMDEYIKQLILEIQISYTQPNHIIEMDVDLDAIQLDFDTSIPLGLIINELVTNAYKHAFPSGVGHIWVSFKKLKKNYQLIVKDNGIGTPDNYKEKMENSLGMELIHLLSQQINAQLSIIHDKGLEVKITMSSND
jgi:two-component sensor histidine kinase